MRLYRWVARLLPHSFRTRHASEMEAVFAEMLQAARARGRFFAGVEYVRGLIDLARQGAAERMRSREGEETMLGRWMDAIRQDATIASRGFLRAPGFAAIAVLTLALGIGSVTAVYSFVNAVLIQPLPYDAPERLFALYNRYPTLDVQRGRQSPGDLADYRDQADLFEAFGSVSVFPQTMIRNGLPERVEVALVTPGFFAMLGVEPVLGRDIVSSDDHDVAVIGHAYWRDALGSDPSVLGRTLRFDRGPKTIIGVLPEHFEVVLPPTFGVPADVRIWTPIPAQGWGRDNRDRSAHWMNVVGRLRRGVDVEQARRQLEAVAAWQREQVDRRRERQAEIVLVGLHDEVTREVRSSLLVLLGAAALVVLIACANVANLLLVRAQARTGEFSVRAALGGGRGRLMRQVVTEGAVLGAVGIGVALVVAVAGIEGILALNPRGLPRVEHVGIDLSVLLFVAGVTVAAVILFSLAGALRASSVDLGSALRSKRPGSGRPTARVADVLIVGEVAVSLALLMGGGLLFRSFAELNDVDPGFETASTLTFVAPIPGAIWSDTTDPAQARRQYYQELERALADIPEVVAVAHVWPTPLSGDPSGSTYTAEEGADADEGQLASSQLVTPGWFDAAGIEFLEGRTFRPDEGGDKLIVDRRMAEEMWPGQSAIGRRLKIGWWSGPVWGEVVGVVENLRTHQITADDPPTVYRLGATYAYTSMTSMVRVSGDPSTYSGRIREAVAEVHPGTPVIRLRPLDAYRDDQTATTRFVLVLVGAFGLLALSLAAVGLYGIISYAVGQRMREFGIRLALGAGSRELGGLVLRRGAGILLLGILVGAGLSRVTRRFVEPLLFEVSPGDPWTAMSIAGLLTAVGIAACLIPARRAAGVDPVVSLRSD